MESKKFSAVIVCLGLLASFAAPERSWADIFTLLPVADTSLMQNDPTKNFGGNTNLHAGFRRLGGEARGLVQFDLTGLPTNAVINSASLTLTVIKTPDGAVNSTFELHRILQSWGGGDNAGTLADVGEATWNERMASLAGWTVPGGQIGTDFDATISGSLSMNENRAYTFLSASDDDLLRDVQGWYANPGMNYGWMFMSTTTDPTSIRSFAALENGTDVPVLTLNFTLVPEPGVGSLLVLGGVGLYWLRRHVRPRA